MKKVDSEDEGVPETAKIHKPGVRDQWKKQYNCIVPVHRRPTRALLTPFDIKSDGEMFKEPLQCLRVARGVYEDGTSFCFPGIVDESAESTRCHGKSVDRG